MIKGIDFSKKVNFGNLEIESFIIDLGKGIVLNLGKNV